MISFCSLGLSGATSSHFVEFEWTTAVALRKPVVPCLLDRTPLPSALQAVQGIDMSAPDASARLGRPPGWSTFASPDTAQVLHASKDISATVPEEVASQAGALYAQQGWNIQGNVYQAKGNMYITVQQPAEGKQEKSKLETWSKRLGLVAVSLGMIISLFTLSDKMREMVFPPSTPLRGQVLDIDRNPSTRRSLKWTNFPESRRPQRATVAFPSRRSRVRKVTRSRVFVKKSKYKEWNEYVALPGPVRITLEEMK